MHLDLDNARHSDQKQIMKMIIAAGESPFLPQNLSKYLPHPIIKQGKFWYITKNQWPYDNTLHHYLIIANQYWTRLDQITPAAASEIAQLAQWLNQQLSTVGGALTMRFGDTNYSGATIDHLHWHFIVPNITSPTYEKVKFTIGKKAAKIKAKQP